MMKCCRISAIILLLLSATGTSAVPASIADYQRCTGIGVTGKSHDSVIVLRDMRAPDRVFLAVDPDSLTTAMYPQHSLSFTPASWKEIRRRFARTPYVAALLRSADSADAIQDAGFRRFHPPVRRGGTGRDGGRNETALYIEQRGSMVRYQTYSIPDEMSVVRVTAGLPAGI